MCGAARLLVWDGRGERIRTSDLYVPNVALYQAKLHPEMAFLTLYLSDHGPEAPLPIVSNTPNIH